MHLATSPQAPAHQALPHAPQPACPCVARLCQVKSSTTRNTVFRGKKKTALNKPFLLHLGKARPRGKTKHPRQQTGGRLEPGVGWTGKLGSLGASVSSQLPAAQDPGQTASPPGSEAWTTGTEGLYPQALRKPCVSFHLTIPASLSGERHPRPFWEGWEDRLREDKQGSALAHTGHQYLQPGPSRAHTPLWLPVRPQGAPSLRHRPHAYP